VKFAFIRDHKAEFPVEVLCEVLEVSRGGYYAWTRRPPSPAALRRDRLVAEIRQAHTASRGAYGSPRVYRALKARGVPCSENTVAELMRAEGVRAKARRPFVVPTTDSRHDRPVAKNILNRQFYPDRPNEVWTADITYIPTREGWLYLAAVEDLYSRQIVGWSMGERIDSRLVVDALEMAVARRLPGAGLVAHSDRGSQYASEHYQRLLAGHGITCSMSRRANCWDNAPMESFFATLKKELVHDEDYATRDEARASLFEYIEVFYNRVRRHSALGYRSPVEYERAG
jgi:putative transposase